MEDQVKTYTAGKDEMQEGTEYVLAADYHELSSLVGQLVSRLDKATEALKKGNATAKRGMQAIDFLQQQLGEKNRGRRYDH